MKRSAPRSGVLRATGLAWVIGQLGAVLGAIGIGDRVISPGTSALAGQESAAKPNEADPSSERERAAALASHFLDLNFEALGATGITLFDGAAGYRQLWLKSEWTLSVSYGATDLDYEPADFDIISLPGNVRDERVAFQSGLKRKLQSNLTLLGAGGAYDGFMDYRALWLNEYYRQYYSGVLGYTPPDPRGYQLSGGLRWEYAPASGFLQVEAIYSRDEVAPGYHIEPLPPPGIGFELQRTTDRLQTVGARLSLENVLSRRIRTLNEFQVAHTTDRDPRFSYQGSLNWALGERWVIRSVLGLSLEEPTFRSFSLGSTLEYDWEQKWFASLFGRFYKDNGEVDNPQLINVAAPSLETFQVGMGLRRQGERWSFKIVAGPYFTRYAAVEADIKPFEKLYRARDWWMAQAALGYSF